MKSRPYRAFLILEMFLVIAWSDVLSEQITKHTEPLDGAMEGIVLPYSEHITRVRLHSAKLPTHQVSWVYSGRIVGIIGIGTDKQFHFVNGFFSGVRPKSIKDPIEALRYLSKAVTYQTDATLHSAPDIFQTSAETLRLGRGDCEDHAILLADWLIQEGFDARVALGTRRNEYHAWVLLFNYKDGVYIIETTDKKPAMTLELASEHPEFVPEKLFNDRLVWEAKKSTDPGFAFEFVPTARFHPGAAPHTALQMLQVTGESPFMREYRCHEERRYQAVYDMVEEINPAAVVPGISVISADCK